MENCKIVLDPFSYKAFECQENSPPMIEFDRDDFTNKVNVFYLEQKETELKDGYAPFCKHLFLPNFTETKNATMEITSENESLIICEYEA